jgi:hypothetical protein
MQTGDFKTVFAFLRTYKDNPSAIGAIANQLVILKSIYDATTHAKEVEFLTNHDVSKNPPLVHTRELHHCGAVSREIAIHGRVYNIDHIKTTFFKALLMIPGTTDIALRMMELAPQGNFNHNDDPLATTSAELALVNSKFPVFQKLVTLPDFNIAQCNIDRSLGASTPLIQTIAAFVNELPPSCIKALCTNLAQVNQLVQVESFSTKGINLLMMAAYYGKTKLCKELIKHGADASIVTEGIGGERLSAISFAGPNMTLIKTLIEAECPFTGNFVNLIGRMHDACINIAFFARDLYALIAKRDFYQKAVDLVKETSVEKQEIALSQITQATSEKVETELPIAEDVRSKWSPPSIDLLLLQYFTAEAGKKEELASKIQELCASSAEASLEIISTLNTQYLDHVDVTTCVYELLADPKKIHQYFQSRKQLIQKRMEELETQTHHSQETWTVDGKIITESDTFPVQSSMMHKIYVWVAESLKSLVLTGMEHLKILSEDSLGQNGIKFLHKQGIIELKTKALGDKRLVAEGVHVNKQGDMLVCFAKLENHQSIACMGGNTSHVDDIDA